MKKHQLIIIGAGASGLMCASYLYEQGHQDIIVLDHNPKIGMKIKVSGGGKCNVTNEQVSEDNYLGDTDFVKGILKEYTPKALLGFLKQKGVIPKIRSLGQYFCTRSAQEVIDALCKDIPKSAFHLGIEVKKVEKKENFVIHTSQQYYESEYLLIATGSPAYPQVGGSDIGLSLAKNLGHQYTRFEPVLVGWTVQKEQFWMKELSGISTYVGIDVGHKVLYGNLLFAHKGISGPAVLSASLYWKKGSVTVDFLAKKNIQDIFVHPKKQLSTQMPLPKRLSKHLLSAIGLEDVPLAHLNKQEKEALMLLKRYPMSPAGNFGLKKAEACRGGVLTEEVDALSLQSRLHPKLYFAGEILDVTGELGGYNFQWAFASAIVCAKHLNSCLSK